VNTLPYPSPSSPYPCVLIINNSTESINITNCLDCFYECNQNPNCSFYSWDNSEFFNWDDNGYCYNQSYPPPPDYSGSPPDYLLLPPAPKNHLPGPSPEFGSFPYCRCLRNTSNLKLYNTDACYKINTQKPCNNSVCCNINVQKIEFTTFFCNNITNFNVYVNNKPKIASYNNNTNVLKVTNLKLLYNQLNNFELCIYTNDTCRIATQYAIFEEANHNCCVIGHM
jgi:hypothetical protein